MKKTHKGSSIHIWMQYNPEITLEEWDARFHRLKNLRIQRVFMSGTFGKDILNLANNYHIELHAWIHIVKNSDTHLINYHKDWFMVNRNRASSAGHSNWLCMNNPVALDFVLKNIEMLCMNRQIDGIHMDSIRYPQVVQLDQPLLESEYPNHADTDETDHCYCSFCREKFKRKHGVDPIDLADPDTNEKWRNFRIETINKVVRQITNIARKYRKFISAMVYPTPEIAHNVAFQEWEKWDIDAIYPALFNDLFLEGSQWLSRCIHEGIEAANIPLYAGLHLPSFSAEMLDIALDAVWEASGSALFAFENLRHEHDDVLRRRRFM